MKSAQVATLRSLEVGAFIALALALHALALFLVMRDDSAATGAATSAAAGSQGNGHLTLQTADARTAALVATWEKQPQTQEATPRESTPPPLASLPALRAMPLPIPTVPQPSKPPASLQAPQPPETVTTPTEDAVRAYDSAPQSAPSPSQRPARIKPAKPPQKSVSKPPQTSQTRSKPARQQTAPPASASQKPVPAKSTEKIAPAKGTGKDAVSGATAGNGNGGGRAGTDGSGQAAAPVNKQARRKALRAWGNTIRAAVDRKKTWPENRRRTANVTLTLTVARNGSLLDVRVQKGSTSEPFNAAALAAARRAAPFAEAPDAVKVESYSFTFTIRFKR